MIRMTDSTMMLTGLTGTQWKRGDAWILMQAQDTGVTIAVRNARPEPDYDEDGYCGHSMEWDALFIVEPDDLRDLTRAESDEYTDDVREYLRSLDWSY